MSEENPDLRKVIASYLGILYRAIGYWKWGAAVCLIVTVGGTVYAATRRKIYMSSTRIRVVRTEVRNPGEFGEEDVGEFLKGRLKQFVGSRRFLQEIVDEYGLYREEKAAKAWTDEEVLAYMRTKMNTGVYHGDEFAFYFYDYDPRKAQAVTKALAQNFMDREKGADYAIYRTKLRRVTNQLEQLEAELDRALAKQTAFNEVNADLIKQLRQRQLGGVAATPGGDDPLTGGSAETQATRNDSPQLRKLRNRLRTLEETANRLRAKSQVASGQANAACAQRRGQAVEAYNRAKVAYDRLRQQYTEEWPDVRTARNRMRQAEAAKRQAEAQCREVARGGSASSAELASIQAQIKQVREEVRRQARREMLARTQGPSKNEPADAGAVASAPRSLPPGVTPLKSVEEVESALKRMETEIRPLRDQVQELHIQRLKLQFQTKQREQGQYQFVVVDPANLPTKPSGPNRTKIAALSAAGGFALGLGLMVLLGFIDSRVYRPSDLARLEQLPLLVTIPDFEPEIGDTTPEASSSSREGVVDQAPPGVIDG